MELFTSPKPQHVHSDYFVSPTFCIIVKIISVYIYFSDLSKTLLIFREKSMLSTLKYSRSHKLSTSKFQRNGTEGLLEDLN